MTVKKRKKATRARGSGQCGWGRMHRGAGQRGGRGKAGRGKKSHCQKPLVWGTKYFGKHGFKSKGILFDSCPINIREIEDKLALWQSSGVAKKSGEQFEIELAKAGYNKLLSTGKPTRKYSIKVEQASAGAIEKIKSAGGTVVLKSKTAKPEKMAKPSEKEIPTKEKLAIK